MKLTVCQSVANCPYTVTDNGGLAGPRYDMLLNFCLLPHTEAEVYLLACRLFHAVLFSAVINEAFLELTRA